MSYKGIKACSHRVVMRKLYNGEFERSNLLIKRSLPVEFGEVVSVGDGVEEVSEGDLVYFKKGHGTDFDWGGEVLRMVIKGEMLCYTPKGSW